MWNWLPTRVCLDLQICPLVDTLPGKVLLKTHSQRGLTFSEAMSDLRVVLWNVWNEECALCKNTPNAANSNVTNSPDKVKPVLYPRAKAQEQNLQFVLNRKTKQKILGQPSERPVKVTLVPFSYVSPPGNAAKSISPAPRPTPYFHWMEVMSQNKWDCRRHSLHGCGTGVSSRVLHTGTLVLGLVMLKWQNLQVLSLKRIVPGPWAHSHETVPGHSLWLLPIWCLFFLPTLMPSTFSLHQSHVDVAPHASLLELWA